MTHWTYGVDVNKYRLYCQNMPDDMGCVQMQHASTICFLAILLLRFSWQNQVVFSLLNWLKLFLDLHYLIIYLYDRIGSFFSHSLAADIEHNYPCKFSKVNFRLIQPFN